MYSQRNHGLTSEELLIELQHMLDQFNPYAERFRTVRDRYCHTLPPEFTMRMLDTRISYGRQYNRSTANEVAALLVGQGINYGSHHDIVLHTSGGQLQRISETHSSYMSLQYPLLFLYGEHGWKINIPYNMSRSSTCARQT